MIQVVAKKRSFGFYCANASELLENSLQSEDSICDSSVQSLAGKMYIIVTVSWKHEGRQILGAVIQRVDITIHWINRYLVDETNPIIYPLDSDQVARGDKG